MFSLLLAIIYIAFISLGLPDAIMGSAWPVIHEELSLPVSSVGIFYMMVSGCTIISSLLSEKMIRRFGTGKVTAVSVTMTAAALLLISFAPNFIVICLLALPLGLGAGAVDAALNNFVALHYSARHMSWLHCFWGIGATAGPFVMSFFLLRSGGWRMGYTVIGCVQAVLAVALFATLPMWKKQEQPEQEAEKQKADTRITMLLKLKGAKPALVSFFCYCSLEATTGLWGASYLVIQKGINAETAAQWVSMYYFGIAVGRFINGFASGHFTNKQLIRVGQCTALAGTLVLLLPFGGIMPLIGLMLIGLGCAPVYPAMLHETPRRFGKDRSQGFTGIQMATAYVGSTFMPPLLGALAGALGFWVFPFYTAMFAGLLLFSSELVNKTFGAQKQGE